MSPSKKPKKNKKNKKNKGVVHTGDRILWTPTWSGGSNGKPWYKRLKEIQHNLDKRATPPEVKVTRRRPRSI